MMKLKQTNVMFMVLALVSALVFLQSEAGNYCPLENINSIPGCFDALKLATGKDISKLTRACCRAVFSVSSDTCYLLLFPGKAYPIKIFRDIFSSVLLDSDSKFSLASTQYKDLISVYALTALD
ncbi:hypothetical protein YC2023_063533 [Brassica napus]